MTIPDPGAPEVYAPETAADDEAETEDERDARDERATANEPEERPGRSPER